MMLRFSAVRLGNRSTFRRAWRVNAVFCSSTNGNGVKLFRGLRRDHPSYQDALRGEVFPSELLHRQLRNEKFPAFEDRAFEELWDLAADHNDSCLSSTGSPFTSWTRNRDVAIHHAKDEKNSDNGVVIEATIGKEITHCFPSPNEWAEDEILVYGPVQSSSFLHHPYQKYDSD